tara:strand:+ start:12785 stop:13057 length:273 start_codon:yes stop_codon:yes gene_type:complete
MFRPGGRPTTDSRVTLVYADWRSCRLHKGCGALPWVIVEIHVSAKRDVTLVYDERILDHAPDVNAGTEFAAVEEAIAFHLSALTGESSGE